MPAGAIDDVLTAFASPAAAALDMLTEVEHPALGVLRQAGIPIQLRAHARRHPVGAPTPR